AVVTRIAGVHVSETSNTRSTSDSFMSPLSEMSRRPATVTADEQFAPWFSEIAARLLNNGGFVVDGKRYRFAELEVYSYGDTHADLLANRDPLQLEDGRWYFHRTRGEYRGGSFKGLDLTLGDSKSFFGILIRTVVAADGTILDGPCVTVDHLLAKTKAASV